MTGIEEYLNTSPTIPHLKFPDQDLLADYFKGRWKVLPWWCNALKTLRAVHQDIWADEEVRLIHFM
jgi:lipopolysaccharide biosynthesis glycosyltransferase